MEEINLKEYRKNIKVFIQILPTIHPCWDDVKILSDNKTVYVRRCQDFSKGYNSRIPNYWSFSTDGILHNLNQNDLYRTVIGDALYKALLGIDVLVFAYGQTGTGKSSTISGLQNSYESRGLIPRILTELFHLKEQTGYKFRIKYSVSFVEIEKIFVVDLLKNEGSRKLYNPYKNLRVVKINSACEGLKMLFEGEARRSILHSSYVSHKLTSIFTIHIRNFSRVISKPVETFSKIHIIDMAGIDTDGNTTCLGKSSQQVGIANLNKSQLEQCLMILQDDLIKKKIHIKDAGILVDYLGQSLKPQNMIKFIGHIRTTRENLHVTISALRFSNMARSMKAAKFTPYVVENCQLKIAKLQNEVDQLKHQHYLDSMLMNNDLSCNLTQARMDQIRNSVEEYLKNKSTGLELMNVIDVETALKCFKDKYDASEVEKEQLLNQIPQPKAPSVKNLPSKTSVINMRISKEKGSKTQTVNSYESKTSRKRKSRDVRSSGRGSKISVPDIKSNIGGSIMRSGLSLGQIMRYSFEGDVTKSLKQKIRMLKPLDSAEKFSSKISQKISDLKIPDDIIGENETIWNYYVTDENYRFGEMTSTLKAIEQSSKEMLKEYNEMLNKLQNKLYLVDIVKNQLLQVQLHKETSNMKCMSADSIKIRETEEKLTVQVIDLVNETIEIKEGLLNQQTELKINIDYYHRVTLNMRQDFKNYCNESFKMPVPMGEQTAETIEDKLLTPEPKSLTVEKTNEETEQEEFNKLQKELKKTQRNIKRLSKKNHK